MKNEKEIDNVIYSYTSAGNNDLEEENKLLKDTITQLKNELDRLKRPPLMVCEVLEIIGQNAIIKVPNGNKFFVTYSADCEKLEPGDSVLTDQKNLNIISKIGRETNFNVESFVIMEKPTIKWEDIGGLENQIKEIQEVVELPLKKPQLFKKMGIQPPKGVLLYGPPGTGKTILAKAVASSTNSTFIEVVGSELIQKFIGEGAKLVKEIFELAKQKAPSIIFIDEIDALAAKRIEIGTSGEREVQRTFMQFLAEIDGFKSLGNVKIIGCTNRKDILDSAILRPGRLDRHIHVDLPKYEGIKQIFKIHSKNMKLAKNINLDKIVKKIEANQFSGAEIRAVCTEAGYFAIRENRFEIKEKDLLDAVDKVQREEELEGEDYLRMFG